MTAEHYIKRTIFEAKCECGETDVRENRAPRSKQCSNCGKWVDFHEVTAIGPDLNLPGYVALK